MRTEVNGIGVNYVIEGPANAPVVTLGHSLATNLEMWAPQMAALTERHQVLRYDTRGHGGTDAPPGPYTLDLLAEDLRALLAALGIDRTHYVGLSMGGMVGQQLAVRHADVFRSLVLADTLSCYPPEAMAVWDDRIQAASGPDGLEPLVEPTIERWFTRPFRRGNHQILDGVRRQIRATAPQGYIGCCHALKHLNLTEALSAVRLPTLVLVGRQDSTTPVAGAEVIRDALADAELVVIEDAAHISNIEQPEVFGRALTDFLGRADGDN